MEEHTTTHTEIGRAEVIRDLETLAKDIRDNIHLMRRPLFVEFSGLPKSGKTTSVNSLALFLRRNGIPTKVVSERASVCPIENKDHPFFNVWTSCTALAQFLENVQRTDYQVVLLDRGMFDSLVWMTLHHTLEKLSDDELTLISRFLLLPRWKKYMDIVIHMTCTVDLALHREFKDLLTEKQGSIMNVDTLTQFKQAADQAKSAYRQDFSRFIEIDTTTQSVIEGVGEITKQVLMALKDLVDEKLLVLPAQELRDRLTLDSFLKERTVRTVSSVVSRSGVSLGRSVAERDPTYIQIVACGVVVYEHSVVVFRRGGSQSDRLLAKHTVWVGGHLRWDDWAGTRLESFHKALTTCVTRELEEEINLSLPTRLKLRGFVYDRTSPRSLQHIGAIFEIRLNNADVVRSLVRHVHRERTGQELEAALMPLAATEFKDIWPTLEPWSIDILRSIYGIGIPVLAPRQQFLL